MPTTQIIYGLECTLPDQPSISKIDGNKLAVKKQKFRRVELPESFDDVEFDADKNPIFTEEQVKFIDRELDRCINGYWCMVKGVPTYLPGNFYYYVNFWTLESGLRPEYRESDRQFYIFFEEAYNDPYILAMTIGKNRRRGATSKGCCLSVKIATFAENQRCGLISKTGRDAEDAFQSMIVPGFEALPIFLQPRRDNSNNAKTKLNFVEEAKRGKGARSTRVVGKREGLGSSCDFRNTRLNSYDSGRLSFLLGDEFGKIEEMDVRKYWLIVQNVLVQGASKVGFGYFPTTVNPPQFGGDRYKDLWDKADQFKYGRETPQRMVRFFQKSEDGYAGFIDEYGFSVIDPPDNETLKHLIDKQKHLPPRERIPEKDLAKGAAKYLDDQLARLTEVEDISEFRRMFPRKEDDMFDFGDLYSPFSIEKIITQETWLKDNPKPLRKGRLVWNYQGKVDFYDDRNGGWLFYGFPKETNQFILSDKICRPINTLNYAGGCDPFKYNQTETGKGSSGAIVIMSKIDKTAEVEGGEICAIYCERPRDKEAFHKEMLLSALFFGCEILTEKEGGDSFWDYFQKYNFLEVNCLPLLGKKPEYVIDPTKTGKSIRDGRWINSADPFSLSRQLDAGVIYVLNYCERIYYPTLLDELKRFDPDKRTKFDTTVAFLICLTSILSNLRSTHKKIEKRTPLVQVYQVQY